LNMVGGQNSQSSAAGNTALLGALLGKLDLGKLTSGLMGLVSTNTANEKPEETSTTTSGKKKPSSGKKKTDSKKTDSKKKESTTGKKTDSKKKTGTTGKKTSTSSKKTSTTAKKSAPESTLDKVTGILGNLLK